MTDREPASMSEALRLAEVLERAVKATDAEDYCVLVARWYVVDAAAELRRLHAEAVALMAEVKRLRLMQPVIIGPTGQSNMLTAGEIDAIDAARKEST